VYDAAHYFVNWQISYRIWRFFSPKIEGVAMAATKVGVVMGSNSDWPVMENAVKQLEVFGIDVEAKVVSAHRTPDMLFEYAESARERGIACIIAGAGGAAHLPGMLASKTTVPVLGVPVPSRYLKGMDSLLSIVQMPRGIPVATFAIGEAGAANAALYAIAMLAVNDSVLAEKLEAFRNNQHATVLEMTLPPQD
jgi:5-(carboxyamino)imidazole ribonucleotide mutase